MCMVDYGEGWRVFHSEWRTARKQHQCYECNRTIEPGERYYHASGIGSGETTWDTYHECAHCQYAAAWLVAECDGYLFGGVLEDLEDHWREEPDYRRLDLGRRIVGMRRRWRNRDGSLMAVPAFTTTTAEQSSPAPVSPAPKLGSAGQ